MPKLLFYAGTACCFFVALLSAAMIVADVPSVARVWWGIAIALLAGLSIASLFLRMAALLAARNLFAALMAVLFVAAAMASLAGVLLLEWRIAEPRLAEVRGAALLALGFFVSLALLSLRPYFNIQASRFLSAIVLLPLPLFLALLAQKSFVRVYLGAISVIFFSTAVHCIRHRHLFLEMTNLRELLDPRGDHRPLAFDT
jgi:hypothetical protein